MSFEEQLLWNLDTKNCLVHFVWIFSKLCKRRKKKRNKKEKFKQLQKKTRYHTEHVLFQPHNLESISVPVLRL